MSKLAISVCLFIMLSVYLPAQASNRPHLALDTQGVYHGGSSNLASATRDTIVLIGPWGSGAQINGQFQSPTGAPAWNGWTHHDITQLTGGHWHISDYFAADLNSTPNNLAMYCGDETIPACNAPDVEGGYGNSWDDILQFQYTVANPAEPCDLTVSGVFSHNTEPGYDFTIFSFETPGGEIYLDEVDDVGVAVPFSYSLTYNQTDYLGANQDQIRFMIKVSSDGAWSDHDCLYSGNGACQFDDVRVQVSNGDYDHTSDFQDGFGDWEIALPLGTGDFTDLWMGLEDLDPCVTNYTSQVAFIDDGTKVPGVGPSHCIDWCYGPGGYIVNTTGGAAAQSNPDAYLYNEVRSPVVIWPDGQYTGAKVELGVYRHEDLSADSPGIFYNWRVRSALSAEGIEDAGWQAREFVIYGGPDYVRAGGDVSDLLEPGVNYAQVQLVCYELGWLWGWFGDDGYPAPYFDNVRLTAFTRQGPGMFAREYSLAQDNFPEIGHLDMGNLAGMNVRFDSASNKNNDATNTPGDSIICDVSSLRAGGELVQNRLHYTMQRNPVFDSVRDANWGDSGYVDGEVAVNSGGNPVPGRFAYDLPDSGFLFPGDVLHYYFSATDEVDNADAQTTTVPSDLSGYGDFSYPLAYNSSFEVHCLPSVQSDGTHPDFLLWNDAANRGGQDEWFSALANIGFGMGTEYDVYYTNWPSSGLGNGLGGRATPALLSGYSSLLYTCGDLAVSTISNGDPTFDPGQDVQLLTSWFNENPVNAFFCGDNIVSDLWGSGPTTSTFLADYLNVGLESNSIRPFINNQTTPLVIPEPNNGVFNHTEWIAYGGCFGINNFDAVTSGPGAVRLARFTNPSGQPDYSYSAATLNQAGDDLIISLPYDFMSIYTNPDNPSGFRSARADFLYDITIAFGFDGHWHPSDVPEASAVSAKNHPNPFNPSTRITFNLPNAGHLGLKVFNLRGELVKTLIDETRLAGAGHIMWDGTNDQGSDVSSGIYFYEARTGQDVKVGKMALVK